MDIPQKIAENEKVLAWKKLVDKMPVLSVDNIKGCERELRRAHLVLAFIVQIYAHATSSTESITIPRSLTVPLLHVSHELNHAPFITYSDHALHNWSHKNPRDQESPPTCDNLQSQLTFTGTPDEDELYIIDIRMELKGAEAIELMRLFTNEIDAGNNLDIDRITMYLTQTTRALEEMKGILLSTKELVRPEIFYNDIRPWLVGADADPWSQKWAWEGKEDVESSEEALKNISGPTAGQSPLLHTLDAYLGIKESNSKSSFLDRIQGYMDHKHRTYLQSLRSRNSHIRSFVQDIAKKQGTNSPVVVAYNAIIKAFKSFRDAHLIIVALYVIIPSRKNTKNSDIRTEIPSGDLEDDCLCEKVAGTRNDHTGEVTLISDQGTELMNILKGFRNQTSYACLE
ncbi:hypothetical protein TrVGV298_004756 [Trichoderma virens]|nr:hypothetical protein TrVGV298_004756 [Trichoderma virens]